jgi:hypothetical protein
MALSGTVHKTLTCSKEIYIFISPPLGNTIMLFCLNSSCLDVMPCWLTNGYQHFGGTALLTWHSLVLVITCTQLCSVPIKKATIYMSEATKTSNLSIFCVDSFFYWKRSINVLGIFHISHVMLQCIVPFYIFSFPCTLWRLSCRGNLYLISGTWLFALPSSVWLQ